MMLTSNPEAFFFAKFFCGPPMMHFRLLIDFSDKLGLKVGHVSEKTEKTTSKAFSKAVDR